MKSKKVSIDGVLAVIDATVGTKGVISTKKKQYVGKAACILIYSDSETPPVIDCSTTGVAAIINTQVSDNGMTMGMNRALIGKPCKILILED